MAFELPAWLSLAIIIGWLVFLVLCIALVRYFIKREPDE